MVADPTGFGYGCLMGLQGASFPKSIFTCRLHILLGGSWNLVLILITWRVTLLALSLTSLVLLGPIASEVISPVMKWLLSHRSLQVPGVPWISSVQASFTW